MTTNLQFGMADQNDPHLIVTSEKKPWNELAQAIPYTEAQRRDNRFVARRRRMPIGEFVYGSEEYLGFKVWLFEEIDALFEGEIAGPGQYPFGWSRDERNALKTLIANRAWGMSFRNIAGLLNRLEIPCRRKGTKWHSWTVNRIVWWVTSQNRKIKAVLTPIEPPPDQTFVDLKTLCKDLRTRETELCEAAWEQVEARLSRTKKQFCAVDEPEIKSNIHNLFLNAKRKLKKTRNFRKQW